MNDNYSKIDFHKFVDDKLDENGFKIRLITRELMEKRINDIMNFVNEIRTEYKEIYDWSNETREYFMNGLVDKWKYSYFILNTRDEICFLNFSSVYGDIIHNHCTYARNDTRNYNFAKLQIIKLCQTGLDNGFTHQEGYWPKNNNRSIVLFLKMGWEIQSIRNNKDLLMIADLKKVRNQTFELIIKGK